MSAMRRAPTDVRGVTRPPAPGPRPAHAEASFFPLYLEKGVFEVSPFDSIDREGVGRLVEPAVEAGRSVNPRLETGVCGEHGGDPDSIHFFHRTGLDYVSCSPFRIPAARLEAGRAALMETTGSSDSR